MSDLSEEIGLQTRYTNHSIRVTGITNLTRSHYTPCQIVCLQSLGMPLVYSLMHPLDVQKVLAETLPVFEIEQNSSAAEHATLSVSTIPSLAIATPKKVYQVTNNEHLQVPAVQENSTLNTESALVPYVPPEAEEKLPQVDEPGFDILELLSDGSDVDLIMAATQIENQMNTTTTMKTSTSVVKKSSPNRPKDANKSGWKFGNIGTLNINIYHK